MKDEELLNCPLCGDRYGFINCRYTKSDHTGVYNMCLNCAVLASRGKLHKDYKKSVYTTPHLGQTHTMLE